MIATPSEGDVVFWRAHLAHNQSLVAAVSAPDQTQQVDGPPDPKDRNSGRDRRVFVATRKDY